MSAIIFLPGRANDGSSDHAGKETATQPIRLWTSPAPNGGADGNKETVFYSCYFNSFLAGPPDEKQV